VSTAILAAFITIVALHLFLLRQASFPTFRRKLTKCLLMPVLICYFLAVSIEQSVPANGWILAGLICGFFGDFFLVFKRQSFFALGLFAFLIGHLSYSIYLLSFLSSRVWTLWLWVSLLVFGAIFIFLYRLLQSGLGNMKIPVILYIPIIEAMSFIASLRVVSDPQSVAAWTFFAGSICFLVSDSFLAVKVFKRDFLASEWLIMGSYILAQFLICQSHFLF